MSPNAPKIENDFFVIINQEDKELAAVISSYLFRSGFYLPMFFFEHVAIMKPTRVPESLGHATFSSLYGINFNNQVHNALRKIRGCKNLILAGLSQEQRSYLTFLEEYHPIEIESVSDVDFALGPISPQLTEFINCSPDQILEGLYVATAMGYKLAIHDQADSIEIADTKEGIFIIENVESAEGVAAVNFARSVDAAIKIVPSLKRGEERNIRFLIEDWRRNHSRPSYDELRHLIYERIEGIYFSAYRYTTFFTIGVPYSLYIDNCIPCSYVHLSNRPDFFIFNSIFFEHYKPAPSAVVFSPPEFKNIDETEFVTNTFEANNYYVRELRGNDATANNLDLHIRDFAYDFLHISSHGGQINGTAVVATFTGEDNTNYQLEYDSVVSFAPIPGQIKIAVSQKWFPRKLNGLYFGSAELRERNYPDSVYEQVYSEMQKLNNSRILSETKKENIPDSCCITCSDFNYQAMFDIVAGARNAPIIFNNSCWSWSTISTPFLEAGVRGYIGTLFAIGTKTATLAAETFYSRVFDEPLIIALNRANEVIFDSKYRDAYIFWGLHFTTLKKGNNLAESKDLVIKRSLNSFYLWLDRRGTATDETTNLRIEQLFNWQSDQLENYFKDETIELMAKIKSEYLGINKKPPES